MENIDEAKITRHHLTTKNNRIKLNRQTPLTPASYAETSEEIQSGYGGARLSVPNRIPHGGPEASGCLLIADLLLERPVGPL